LGDINSSTRKVIQVQQKVEVQKERSILAKILEKERCEARREIALYKKEQRKQFKEELKWCENLTT